MGYNMDKICCYLHVRVGNPYFGSIDGDMDYFHATPKYGLFRDRREVRSPPEPTGRHEGLVVFPTIGQSHYRLPDTLPCETTTRTICWTGRGVR